MTPEKILNERDRKLVQWLSEAHAKEAELEADLIAHIALTDKQTYKKRLRQHLTETRDHKRRVAQRIKALGGSASAGPNIPGVPSALGEVAGKAVAAVKGQVGTARAMTTRQPDTHVRNAQEEFREEHVEIAIYNRIETLASEVGDRETERLAKSIRRDEERMAKFLDAEIKRLVKDVVKAEIPRDQRAGGRSGARRTTRTRASASSRSGLASGNGAPAAPLGSAASAGTGAGQPSTYTVGSQISGS
jgi:ferritin-like metal-binding protein YciE